MKNFVSLLILIFIGIAAYTAYSLVSFKPDEAAPFVFNEPTLPPEIIAEQKSAAQNLNAAEEQQKDIAVTEMQKAFADYSAMFSASPQQIKNTTSLLNNRITSLDLPAYFMSPVLPSGVRKFEKLNVVVSNIISIDTNQKQLDCTSKSPIAAALVGSTGKDILACKQDRDTLAQDSTDILFIGGPDDDTITDNKGNRVVNGGTGNDSISLGAGRSIIVLEPAWGKDTLTIDCTGATIQESEKPKGFPIPWEYKTSNFIVLGDGIDPKDVSWKDNVLTSSGGDTLTVNENCFTVVPAAQ